MTRRITTIGQSSRLKFVSILTLVASFAVLSLVVSTSVAFSSVPARKIPPVGCYSNGCTTEWIVTCGPTKTPVAGAEVFYTHRIRIFTLTNSKGVAKNFEAVRANQQLTYMVVFPASAGGGAVSAELFSRRRHPRKQTHVLGIKK